MNCRRVESLLGDYVDGALSIAEQRWVEDHFADCPHCAALREDMDLALGFLRQAPTVELPEGLVANILDSTVHAEPPAGGLVAAGVGSRSWGRPFLQPLFEPRFAMSVALAIVSFSILTWSGQQTLDRWQDAAPVARMRSASVGLDQVWQRGVAAYRRTFPEQKQNATGLDKHETAPSDDSTPMSPR